MSIQYNLVYVFLKSGDRHAFLIDYDGNKLYVNVDDGDNNTYYERRYCEDMYYQNWKLKRINLESGTCPCLTGSSTSTRKPLGNHLSVKLSTHFVGINDSLDGFFLY